MKYRKSNRSKLVCRSCGNHGACAWCESDRLHSVRVQLQDRADTTTEAEDLAYAESHWCDPTDGEDDPQMGDPCFGMRDFPCGFVNCPMCWCDVCEGPCREEI